MSQEKQKEPSNSTYQKLSNGLKAPSWLSGFMAVAKFILDLADDILLGIKDFLSVTLHTLHGIMGTTFGVLTGYSAYESYKDFARDWRREYDDHTDEDHDAFLEVSDSARKRRMVQNAINTSIFTGAFALSVLLIFAAWVDIIVTPTAAGFNLFGFSFLPVLGMAFFPFAITVALCTSSLVKLVNHLIDRYLDSNLSEDEISKLDRKIFYQAIDFISMLIIVVGLSLATFTALAGVTLFPFMTAPLLMIVFGAAVGVIGKLFEFEVPSKLQKIGNGISNSLSEIFNRSSHSVSDNRDNDPNLSKDDISKSESLAKVNALSTVERPPEQPDKPFKVESLSSTPSLARSSSLAGDSFLYRTRSDLDEIPTTPDTSTPPHKDTTEAFSETSDSKTSNNKAPDTDAENLKTFGFLADQVSRTTSQPIPNPDDTSPAHVSKADTGICII